MAAIFIDVGTVSITNLLTPRDAGSPYYDWADILSGTNRFLMSAKEAAKFAPIIYLGDDWDGKMVTPRLIVPNSGIWAQPTNKSPHLLYSFQAGPLEECAIKTRYLDSFRMDGTRADRMIAFYKIAEEENEYGPVSL